MTIVTECIEDYISEENPVRVIDVFADNLDLDLAGFLRITPSNTGLPLMPQEIYLNYIFMVILIKFVQVESL